MKAIKSFYTKHEKPIRAITICLLLILFLMPFLTTKRVHLHTNYTDKNDVTLYIKKYHELPPNYITKDSKDYYLNHSEIPRNPDYVAGGDTYFNTDDLRSFGIESDTRLKECDIVTASYSLTNRGRVRLVFTCNEKHSRVFYTEDHYETFQELTSFKLQLPRNVFWIIFGVYAGLFALFYGICLYNPQELKPESLEKSDES